MSEPQVWTLLGVFGAVLFSVLAIVHRTMKIGFESLAQRIDAQNVRIDAQGERFESKIDAQVDRLEAKIDAQGEVMAANFADVGHRLHNLEDDMRLVKAHLIGERSA